MATLIAGLPAGGARRAEAQPPLPLTDELRVNQVTAGAQLHPDAAMAASGLHVVVWKSADGADENVVFRRFPADGSEPFSESVVNQEPAAGDLTPSVALNNSGQMVVVWTSTTAGHGLRARRQASGILGNEFNASQATSGAIFPGVARADDGSFAVVFSQSDSLLRLFDTTGTALTGDLPVPDDATDSAQSAIVRLTGGDYLVAYQANESDHKGVFAQRFEPVAGAALDEAFRLSVTVDLDQLAPKVAALPDGGFVAVWMDETLGGRYRLFDGDGTPRGAELATFDNASSVAASLAGGSFVITATLLGEIQAQEYDRLGREVGFHFQINQIVNNTQTGSQAAAGNESFVVVWGSFLGLGDSNQYVARRLYRFRSILADDFELGTFVAWSATSP